MSGTARVEQLQDAVGQVHVQGQRGGELQLVVPPFVMVLVVGAAVACWVPARRAARVHPAIALSAE